MIHLPSNQQQQQQIPYHQSLVPQPHPLQIPHAYPLPTYNSNPPQNQQQQQRVTGKRQKRDDDWDICWDYLSPKGCNREHCRWRHGNPQNDPRQIAKRRKRYMEQNRDRNRNNNNNNNNNRNNRNRNRHRNVWGHGMAGQPQVPRPIVQGHAGPPPPPYYAPPPPTMPPPANGQTAEAAKAMQDYYAQYYAAYGYMQPPVPSMTAKGDGKKDGDDKKEKEQNANAASAYPYNPYYAGYPYPGYPPPYGYLPHAIPPQSATANVAPKVKKVEDEKEEEAEEDDDVKTKKKKKNDENKQVDVITKEVKAINVPLQDEKVSNNERLDVNGINDLENKYKKSVKVSEDEGEEEDVDLKQDGVQSVPAEQGAGKTAVQSLNKKEENENKEVTQNETNQTNVNHQQFNVISIPYPTTIVTTNNNNNIPARHPMFDGMDYSQMNDFDDLSSDDDVDMNASTNNPWSNWHGQYQNYLANYNRTNPIPKTTQSDTKVADAESAKVVFATDPETGGLVQVSADSVSKTTATIAASTNVDSLTLQQHSIQSQQLLQTAQQQLALAIMQSNAANANTNTNNYFTQNTSFSLISPTVNANPGNTNESSAIHPERQAQVQQSMDTTAIIEKSCEQFFEAKEPKKKKRKKSKKKGIESSVKWLYIISDAKRECYGSLCRGQFDSITTTKWLTSMYEETDWGNQVKDRSRGQNDGPRQNHIAWYTQKGCCCALEGVQEAEFAQDGFPDWLQQITATMSKICATEKNVPNCVELFYFEDNSSRWNWHSYCEHPLFGLDKSCDSVKHRGQTIHLLIGNRRQFKFAPRKTKAIPGDEEKSMYLENGDVFVSCGKFTADYVVKIECDEGMDVNKYGRADSGGTMYIVWRWIVKHMEGCPLKNR